MVPGRLIFFVLIASCLNVAVANAQERTPSHCLAFAEVPGIEFLHRAAFGDDLAEETVRLTYIGHSTYALETTGGVTAATDFTGDLGGLNFVPTVVTMNHAHDRRDDSGTDQLP